MTKNHGKNTGFILLIVGAVIAGILALLGLVLGIITWILCGVSITQFRKLQGESNFESNLDFGAVAELKKSSDNDNSTQAAPVQKVEAVPAEQETEAAPVDVDYEVKSEDNSTSDTPKHNHSLKRDLLELKRYLQKRDMKNIETKFYSKEKLEKSINDR